jgi:hypothetical protein
MLDALGTFYLICFLFGAVFIALSLVTGAAHLPLPGAHSLHLGHAVHGHAGGQRAGSFLNVGSALAFLLWFGGIGFLLHVLSPLALVLVLLLSLLAGLAGAGAIAFFLFKVLLPAQTVMDSAQYRLDGTPGRITAAIPAGGTGEITYSKAGTRRSDAARSVDGEAIAHGEEVVILTYKRGVAYVQSLKKYLGSSATDIAGRLSALENEPGVGKPQERGQQ